jgi:hypothetical protein
MPGVARRLLRNDRRRWHSSPRPRRASSRSESTGLSFRRRRRAESSLFRKTLAPTEESTVGSVVASGKPQTRGVDSRRSEPALRYGTGEPAEGWPMPSGSMSPRIRGSSADHAQPRVDSSVGAKVSGARLVWRGASFGMTGGSLHPTARPSARGGGRGARCPRPRPGPKARIPGGSPARRCRARRSGASALPIRSLLLSTRRR